MRFPGRPRQPPWATPAEPAGPSSATPDGPPPAEPDGSLPATPDGPPPVGPAEPLSAGPTRPDPPADLRALIAAVDAAGLDDERPAPARPGVLWAEGWEPPALTARAAVEQIARACAEIAALDPIDPDSARAVLARIGPTAPAIRSLVALRVASYDELHEDTAAYHLGSLADVAWWAGELLEHAQRAEPQPEWEEAVRASSWADSLGGERFAHPLRGELGHTADALSQFTGDTGFAPSLEPVKGLPGAEQAELTRATGRLAVIGGAVLVRAFALDLPAAAALIAGAPRADGLRLVPGQSQAASAITGSLDPWLMRLVIPTELREALDRVSASRDAVAGTYASHPDPGGHAYGPPEEAFDGPGMDRLEARVAELARLAAAPSPKLDGLSPELDRALGDALVCARGLRAQRGWGQWNEQASGLQSVARLCVRLVAARYIARRDA